MKRVYIGNKELTALATVTNGGGGGDDTQKWVDYFNGTLTEFTIPEGVTQIKDYAFNDYSSLTSVTIPNSVTSIGQWAFEGCPNLTDITLSNSLTSIDNSAFANCTGLTSVILPDSLTTINISAFNYCLNLTGITIPDKVTFIGYGAFGGCAKLTTMTVKATTPPRLGDYAIPDETTTIYVPASSVDTYKSASGWSSFASKIQAMPTPAMKVTYTDGSEKAFYNLISIDENTDSNKANAKEVVIYDGITTIRESAFENCTSLTSVTIPSTTTWIGQSIFNGCTSLSNIIYQGTMAEWNNVKFHGSWHDGVPSTTVVTCSDGTVKL